MARPKIADRGDDLEIEGTADKDVGHGPYHLL
jgi:hypothetical protein